MHRRKESREGEIEQRLKHIIAKAKKADKPERSNKSRIATTLLLVTTAVLLSVPLWFGWTSRQDAVNAQTYYRTKRVTIEYPEDMEPSLRLGPVRSGCAFMPQIKTTSASSTI